MRALLSEHRTPTDLLHALGEPGLAAAFRAESALRPLLSAAEHEADLLRHPYLSPEHVILAAARRGDDDRYGRLWDSLASVPVVGPSRRGWLPRPLGRNSIARPEGQQELDRRQQEAIRREVPD